MPRNAAILQTTTSGNVRVPGLYFSKEIRLCNTYKLYIIRTRKVPGLLHTYSAGLGSNVVVRARDRQVLHTHGATLRLLLSSRSKSYGTPYALTYPTGASYRKCIKLVTGKRCGRTIGLVGSGVPLPSSVNEVYPRPYRGGYEERFISRPVSVTNLGTFTSSVSVTDGSGCIPCIRPSANGHITVINNKPKKLATTCFLEELKRDIGIFSVVPGVNKVLQCNVPRCELPGGLLSERVSRVRTLKIGLGGGIELNHSVRLRRLQRSFSTMIMTTKT